MSQLIATLHNFTNTHRVADENMFPTASSPNHHHPIYAAAANHHRPAAHRTFSAIFTIIRAPFSLLSCFAPPPVHAAADAFSLSADRYSTISETNHLMVSDGMRYAIFM